MTVESFIQSCPAYYLALAKRPELHRELRQVAIGRHRCSQRPAHDPHGRVVFISNPHVPKNQ